jgi:hypothetical protein
VSWLGIGVASALAGLALIGWVRIEGERRGLFASQVGVALVVLDDQGLREG